MNAQVSVEIAAPVATVWAVVQSPTLRPRWDLRIASYQTAGSPPETFRLVARMGLLRPKAAGRVLLWREERQSAITVDESTSRLLPRGSGSWTFEATQTGTRLTSRFSFSEAGLPLILPGWLFLGIFHYDTLRSFRRLKRMVESGALTVQTPGGP